MLKNGSQTPRHQIWDGRINPGNIRLRGRAYRQAKDDRVIRLVDEYVWEWRSDGSYQTMEECGRLVPSSAIIASCPSTP